MNQSFSPFFRLKRLIDSISIFHPPFHAFLFVVAWFPGAVLGESFNRDGISLALPKSHSYAKTERHGKFDTYYFLSDQARTRLLVSVLKAQDLPDLAEALKSPAASHYALECATEETRNAAGDGAAPAERITVDGHPAIRFAFKRKATSGEVRWWRQVSILWEGGMVDLTIIHPDADENAAVKTLSDAVSKVKLSRTVSKRSVPGEQ